MARYRPRTAAKRFEINVVRVTSKGVVARVAGVDDRNGAEALQGTALYVQRERLPAKSPRTNSTTPISRDCAPTT